MSELDLDKLERRFKERHAYSEAWFYPITWKELELLISAARELEETKAKLAIANGEVEAKKATIERLVNIIQGLGLVSFNR